MFNLSTFIKVRKCGRKKLKSMKKIENYSVQVLSVKEKECVTGGKVDYSQTYWKDGHKYTDYYRRDGHGGWEVYKTILIS